MHYKMPLFQKLWRVVNMLFSLLHEIQTGHDKYALRNSGMWILKNHHFTHQTGKIKRINNIWHWWACGQIQTLPHSWNINSNVFVEGHLATFIKNAQNILLNNFLQRNNSKRIHVHVGRKFCQDLWDSIGYKWQNVGNM